MSSISALATEICDIARTRQGTVPPRRHLLVLGGVEVVEEALADTLEVRRARLREQLLAAVGQNREAAAAVRVAGVALEQGVAISSASSAFTSALCTRSRPRHAPSSAGASSRSGTSAAAVRLVSGDVVPVLMSGSQPIRHP